VFEDEFDPPIFLSVDASTQTLPIESERQICFVCITPFSSTLHLPEADCIAFTFTIAFAFKLKSMFEVKESVKDLIDANDEVENND
jgi:hypothetical protein